MKRNPPFYSPNLRRDETTARRDNPDVWLHQAKRIGSPDIKAWFTVQYHISRSFWVTVNGKWVPRKGVMSCSG